MGLELLVVAAVLGRCCAVSVDSPEAFIKAVRSGASDVLVTKHLDLTGVEADTNSEGNYPELLFPPESVHSIRVRARHRLPSAAE